MPSLEFMQSLKPDLETWDEVEELLCFLLCSFLSPSRMWLSLRLVGRCSSWVVQILLGADEPKLSLFSQVRDDCRANTELVNINYFTVWFLCLFLDFFFIFFILTHNRDKDDQKIKYGQLFDIFQNYLKAVYLHLEAVISRFLH